MLTSLYTYSKSTVFFTWVIQTATISTHKAFSTLVLFVSALVFVHFLFLFFFKTIPSLWYSRVFTFFYICKISSLPGSLCSDIVCCNMENKSFNSTSGCRDWLMTQIFFFKSPIKCRHLALYIQHYFKCYVTNISYYLEFAYTFALHFVWYLTFDWE